MINPLQEVISFTRLAARTERFHSHNQKSWGTEEFGGADEYYVDWVVTSAPYPWAGRLCHHLGDLRFHLAKAAFAAVRRSALAGRLL